MPPMGEPERLRRPKMRLKAETGSGFSGAPTRHRVAIAAQKAEIGIDVVVGGDGIEDEVEAAGMLCHLIRVAGEDNFVGAKAQSVFLLVGRSGEEDDMSSESVGELDAHVAQPAETDDRRPSCPW